MNTAEHIVGVLLEDEGDEAEAFMRNVGFDASRGGSMYALQNRDIIEDELDQLKSAVIRRTAELMPELVRRGIVKDGQAQGVAKMLTFYIVNHHYDPKLWHKAWQKAARQIFSFVKSHASWTPGGSLTS